MLDQILKLGNPKLYERSAEVRPDEVSHFQGEIDLMHRLILEYRKVYGQGRAIAAPQIGLMKRIICVNTDNRYILYNPELTDLSEEMFEVWDDCMSFPGLLVKVRRHHSCLLRFRDENWAEQTWKLENDMSELIQHEYDHLDGILATQRAVDDRSFMLRTSNSGNYPMRV